MYLKSIELTGFKSFVEAKIEFPRGITAIVGPNGTGKSNVVDAILWVLGEQSVKTLRSERMEDVIFNGTETRKPLGMSEVSLVIAGVTGDMLTGLLGQSVPLTGSQEIMITRRLYRNGDSEYLINKTTSRLKDVRSLLLDTRAGMKGHTIIEQGRVDQILNASPYERRELIEETAGIVRYKKQKAEALRKLESTRQNLARVRDIISEVQRQLTSLQRQARQARTFAALQQEAKTLEIRLLVRHSRALRTELVAVETGLADLDIREAGQLAEQAKLVATAEETSLQRRERQQRAIEIREQLSRLQQQQTQAAADQQVVDGRIELIQTQERQARDEQDKLGAEQGHHADQLRSLESRTADADEQIARHGATLVQQEERIKVLADRRGVAADQVEQARRSAHELAVQVVGGENALAALDARLREMLKRAERLNRDQADLGAQRAAEAQRLDQVAREHEAGSVGLDEARGLRQECAVEAGRLEAALHQVDADLAQRTATVAAIQSRLHALKGVMREDIGYGREGEEATSLRDVCRGVGEAAAEWLDVPAGLERAIEAVLGDRVRAWLVDGPDTAKEAVQFLAEKGLGRGAFVPRTPRWVDRGGTASQESWWSAVYGEPGVLGRAVDLLAVSSAPSESLTCLFHGIVVVERLDVALALWARRLWAAPYGPTMVTLAGEIVDPAGVVIGGTLGIASGVLQRRREITELEQELDDTKRRLEADRAEREREAARLEGVRTRFRESDVTVRDTEIRLLTLSKDDENLRQIIQGLDRRVDTVRIEGQADEAELTRIEEESRAIRAQIAEFVQRKAVAEAGLTQASLSLHQVSEEYQSLERELADARLALGMLKQEREHLDEEVVRLRREQHARHARLEALAAQLDELAQQRESARAERERLESLIRELEDQATGVKEALVAVQEDVASGQAQADQVDQGLSAVRRRLAELGQSRTELEVRRAEIKTRSMDLEATLGGTYQMSLAEAEPLDSDSGEGSEAPSADVLEAALREQLQKIRDRLDRMGPINQAAISECDELEQRHRFLTTQEADLTRSIDSLREIINRINRTTRQMFEETFHLLQERFGDVFARFFPGGRAELVLTQPELATEGGESVRSDEPGVDIVAQPPGKRLKSINMLSGGEKTLTAIALVFASFLIRPTPFCLLDEIDAPLDEENIGRFTTVLQELSKSAQFLVITHNKRTMAVVDSLFGVTMSEPGISTLVSVRLSELQPA